MLHKCIGHLAGTAVVALGLLHNLKLQLVDASLDEVFVKLASLEQVELFEQHIAQLAEALAL